MAGPIEFIYGGPFGPQKGVDMTDWEFESQVNAAWEITDAAAENGEIRRLAAHNYFAEPNAEREFAEAFPAEQERQAGLIGNLRRLAADTARWAKAQCSLVCLAPETGISTLSGLGMHRVAECWLRQAAAGAGARRISMQLSRRAGLAELAIHDEVVRPDGHAADAVTLASIEGMAGAVGGSVSILSEAGRGTTLTCRVPCGPDQEPVSFLFEPAEAAD
jgi:hypothetical protein